MSEAALKYAQEEEQEEQLEEDLMILDDTSAVMMLSRIREAEEEYERMTAWYTRQIEMFREKRDRTVACAENSLRVYFDMVPKKTTRTQQTYQLPGAVLTLKKQEPDYDRKDEEVIAWLRKNKQEKFIKVKETVDWAGLKKTLKLTPDGTGMATEEGEIIPGIKAVPKEDKFTVKLS